MTNGKNLNKKEYRNNTETLMKVYLYEAAPFVSRRAPSQRWSELVVGAGLQVSPRANN